VDFKIKRNIFNIYLIIWLKFWNNVYIFLEDIRKNCCPSCNSTIVIQIEEEPLPSSSNKLNQNSEIDEQNCIEEDSSDDSTPINSRSSKIINMCINVK